ncbi:MAG: hypothetical protein JO362_13380 [Streptomycetaceae bacterium]|nr:hypothetical protein [Streptomycetaceae bacterium]
MLLLGFILLAGAAAFTGLLIADNLGGSPSYTPSILGHHVATVSTLGAFLAGIALTLLFYLGLAMVKKGAAYHRRRGADLKAARRSAAERDGHIARVQAPAQADQADRAAEEERVRTAAGGDGHKRRHRIHLFGH